jgi:hypothetical protein
MSELLFELMEHLWRSSLDGRLNASVMRRSVSVTGLFGQASEIAQFLIFQPERMSA